jgi:hypothetical protein
MSATSTGNAREGSIAHCSPPARVAVRVMIRLVQRQKSLNPSSARRGYNTNDSPSGKNPKLAPTRARPARNSKMPTLTFGKSTPTLLLPRYLLLHTLLRKGEGVLGRDPSAFVRVGPPEESCPCSLFREWGPWQMRERELLFTCK